jgi:hypothetical protein
VVCVSSVLLSRRLVERVGPFRPAIDDDYDYWLRAVRAGAVVHYDPEPLVRYRRHEQQMTSNLLHMHRALHQTRTEHADVAADPQLVRTMRAKDLFRIGRLLVDAERPEEARQAFRGVVRNATPETWEAAARALGWSLVLRLPGEAGERGGRTLVGLSQTLEALRGRLNPVRP